MNIENKAATQKVFSWQTMITNQVPEERISQLALHNTVEAWQDHMDRRSCYTGHMGWTRGRQQEFSYPYHW